MSDVLKLHEPGTTEHDAAKYALKVLTLDLVAVRLVRVGARTWWKVFGVVVSLATPVLLLASFPEDMMPAQLSDAQMLRTILAVAVCYTLILVGGFVFMFTRRRERLVAYTLEEDKFTEDLVLLHSSALQTMKYRNEQTAVYKGKKRAQRARRRRLPNQGTGNSKPCERPEGGSPS
ncbi:hypothetical protein [Arthrobacter koreensis]|uniref:hypothetical protein n=1 Tax=Arthrobacter koreensis TaxID=199136 RepID=UPI0037F494CA